MVATGAGVSSDRPGMPRGAPVGWGMIRPVPSTDNIRCPKRMTYGQCGGVRADLSCEIDPRPCPFAVENAVVPWAGRAGPTSVRPASSVLGAIAQGRQVVLTDLTLPPYDAAMVATLARIL